MKRELKILTKNDTETKKFAADLAHKLIDRSPTSINFKTAMVLSLEGDLGAGKTTFAQGFAQRLEIREKIQSPTFVILKIYEITPLNPPYFRGEKKDRFSNFIHVDAYRLKSKDFAALGWKEFIKNPKNIILVEWGNKIKNILPKNSIRIIFKHIAREKRLIEIVGL